MFRGNEDMKRLLLPALAVALVVSGSSTKSSSTPHVTGEEHLTTASVRPCSEQGGNSPAGSET
jgi:hypothetical protein